MSTNKGSIFPQETLDRLKKIFDKAEEEGSVHEFPISLLRGSFGNESSTSPAESSRQIGPVEAAMKDLGISLTRKNWIDLAYLGKPPEEWSQELENELPPHLQDPDWHKNQSH